jgi:hypothetical protein
MAPRVVPIRTCKCTCSRSCGNLQKSSQEKTRRRGMFIKPNPTICCAAGFTIFSVVLAVSWHGLGPEGGRARAASSPADGFDGVRAFDDLRLSPCSAIPHCRSSSVVSGAGEASASISASLRMWESVRDASAIVGSHQQRERGSCQPIRWLSAVEPAVLVLRVDSFGQPTWSTRLLTPRAAALGYEQMNRLLSRNRGRHLAVSDGANARGMGTPRAVGGPVSMGGTDTPG